MISIGVSIDVPDLARGVEFYSRAFGLSKSAEPVPGVVVMRGGDMVICLLEKAAGSQPATTTSDVRTYDRHWTPVHLDLHVDDLDAALECALAAGATPSFLASLESSASTRPIASPSSGASLSAPPTADLRWRLISRPTLTPGRPVRSETILATSENAMIMKRMIKRTMRNMAKPSHCARVRTGRHCASQGLTQA